MRRPLHRLGLLVNPVAGLGGPTGHGGSDDLHADAGAAGPGTANAAVALRLAADGVRSAELVTCAGPMGADAALTAGWNPELAYAPGSERTSAADTAEAVRALVAHGVDLLLFAGGDGTARDVLHALPDAAGVPVLGIPSGVKMQSAVFAVSARAAGRLLAAAIADGFESAPREVLDLDEDEARAGRIVPRLHGVVDVPVAPALMQHAKARRGATTDVPAVHAGLAALRALPPDTTCLVGPGATTLAILAELGIEGTLLGVDAVRDGAPVARGLDADGAARLAAEGPLRVLVSPTGGQGFLLGRGNQQLPPAALHRAGPDGVLIVAGEAKLAALAGRPLLVDTGDPDLDARLTGWRRVLVAPGRDAVYRVEAV